MSSLVILTASAFVTSCIKIEKQTNKPTNKHVNAAEHPTKATAVDVDRVNSILLGF